MMNRIGAVDESDDRGDMLARARLLMMLEMGDTESPLVARQGAAAVRHILDLERPNGSQTWEELYHQAQYQYQTYRTVFWVMDNKTGGMRLTQLPPIERHKEN